jgi:hypothetical protein
MVCAFPRVQLFRKGGNYLEQIMEIKRSESAQHHGHMTYGVCPVQSNHLHAINPSLANPQLGPQPEGAAGVAFSSS